MHRNLVSNFCFNTSLQAKLGAGLEHGLVPCEVTHQLPGIRM
jgi:hypothetical protein